MTNALEGSLERAMISMASEELSSWHVCPSQKITINARGCKITITNLENENKNDQNLLTIHKRTKGKVSYT